MDAIKKINKYMAAEATTPSVSARTLADLIISLESEESFTVVRLYLLEDDLFLLSLELIKEWRVNERHPEKTQALEIALQISQHELPI